MSELMDKDEPQSKRLFVSEEGEPLNFYLRPGPMKRELVPLIRAGGGLMCNFLKKGTILLKDPEERASLPKSTAHLYVSTRYIQDCIEKNERLNIEEYRLIPESPNLAKKKSKSKVDSPALLTGRSAYTTEEDNAILSYVSKHKNEIGGNRLWQEMAKQQVTSHSWQSMKYHYRVQLVHKLSACKQADTENVCSEQNPQPTTTDTATTTAPATAHNDDSTSDPAISEVTTRGNPPTEQALSKAHLFIFESESQEPEEDSEVTTRDNPPTEQALSKAHLFIFESESQELEDNLINVTKALLLASGDLFLAYEILQNPSSFSGPIWTRTDDQRLCSTDQEVRQDLLTKYGEEALAKRLQFLEIEG
uniref:Telomeric repeat-binding factor 2-interacting protein 1 n=1 Tax=Periophthalmus magnuspinnatus TaxID=409849 RepID=A0A3B4AIP1_9GOBI